MTWGAWSGKESPCTDGKQERYHLNKSNNPADIRDHYLQMPTEYVLIEIAAQLARLGNLLEERLKT